MKRLLIPALVILLSGCGKTVHYADMATETTLALAEPSTGSAPEIREEEKADETYTQNENGKDLEDISKGKSSKNGTEKIPAQIIKNASIQFQVKTVEESHQKISDLLKMNNAYFGSDNKSTNSYRIENNMTIRVPAPNFEKLLDAIMQESVYTNYKNKIAEDVTADFVDVEARLKTKKEVEQRYMVLLKQANKVSDILAVENNLRVIREEIEAAEGRLKLLKDQVGYSTITLNTYQNLDYTPEPQLGFFSNLKEAFVNGWRGLVAFVLGLVRVWPFTILFGAAMFFIIRKIRNRKK